MCYLLPHWVWTFHIRQIPKFPHCNTAVKLILLVQLVAGTSLDIIVLCSVSTRDAFDAVSSFFKCRSTLHLMEGIWGKNIPWI